jgi:acyl dehydratase
MRTFASGEDIISAVGDELGASEWTTVTQEQVNMFAEATGDHQWIHVDVERAQRESPFGGPIAHGYLSLSLLPMLGWQIYAVEGVKMGINYGSNKVRFPAPVPVGARVRLRSTLHSAEQLPDGSVQMVVMQVLEIEGHPKPGVVAETISRVAF